MNSVECVLLKDKTGNVLKARWTNPDGVTDTYVVGYLGVAYGENRVQLASIEDGVCYWVQMVPADEVTFFLEKSELLNGVDGAAVYSSFVDDVVAQTIQRVSIHRQLSDTVEADRRLAWDMAHDLFIKELMRQPLPLDEVDADGIRKESTRVREAERPGRPDIGDNETSEESDREGA